VYDARYYSPDRDIHETWFPQRGLFRPDELACVCYLFSKPFWGLEALPVRAVDRVLSIGCGVGNVEAWLETQGCEVIGVETSEAARALYRGAEVVERAEAEHFAWADSVIFVESLEHIPREEIDRLWSLLTPNTRVITVNWPDYFPLAPDGSGWDHVTQLDDSLFDELSSAGIVRVRRASHLVFDI